MSRRFLKPLFRMMKRILKPRLGLAMRKPKFPIVETNDGPIATHKTDCGCGYWEYRDRNVIFHCAKHESVYRRTRR